MVNDVGSSTKGSLLCDLGTESGVLAALALVRGSSASGRTKAELRDLIFNYRASGGDLLLRSEIEAELATLTPAEAGVQSQASTVPANLPIVETSESTVQSAVPRPSYGFPGSRPAPRFEVVKTPAVTPIVPEMAEDVRTTIPVRVAERVITPRVVESDTVLPPPVPEVLPTIPEPLAETPVTEAVASASVSVPSGANHEASPHVTNEAAKNRIAEIKQRVNEKVGNAVNLLDRDNTIGREYMTALLEAMKATASDGDVRGTMARLETAFAKVEALLLAPLPTKEPESIPEPIAVTPAPQVIPPVATEVAPIEPVSPVMPIEPVAPIAPVVSTPKIMPVIPSVAPSEPVSVVSQSTALPQTLADLTANLQPREPVTPPVEPVRPPITSWDSITAAEGAEAVIQPLNVPVPPVVPRTAPVISPVADSTPLKTPADLPTAQELKERSGVVDPLLDVDVDTGLEQLLSEWSLFRKSGIFGTGPKGRQHPLYVTLAPINMSLILSGRFEGATPEIRQSISDYMNGWRYEQGILHQPEETFEHYLRRVIRHIIDLQSRPRR